MKIGVTVGKFWPLHKGHELMIETAANVLDHLTVIVSGNETDSIPLSKRFNIINEKYFHFRNIFVVKYEDTIGEPEKYDEFGTAIDENFWVSWTAVFNIICPNATHFVSSDMYGQEAARRMGIEWLPVDPNREVFNISGTKIRENPYKNFNMISDEMKSLFSKTVTIVGPESTGKTILTKKLTEYFDNSICVPEWGRTISEAKRNNLDAEDFKNIFDMQQTLVESAKRNSPLVFVDSDSITTELYTKLYLKEEYPYEVPFHKHDFYMLMAPTVSWVDDGTRVQPSQNEREKFYEELHKKLIDHKVNFITNKAIKYEHRYMLAASFVDQKVLRGLHYKEE